MRCARRSGSWRWRAILTRICRYQPHAGRLAEREIIARHLTCQHFAPDAENVLIVNGAQHGLAVTVMGCYVRGMWWRWMR
ncbi:GntR family transcriptional regulator domain / Aspartate aminotransferase [Klebsiella pneumoniae]|uniref:GntR family transcriptional regulator domain / Aspartate aminotransferase n=1 Tax=Klebsiella pneumoniae TaxID=573 RepID=A0A2X3C7H9_KLEPN|nr:GntR family transcriptional regulator domain / Aspartate aminotransferase [Klebsiella pneumoniae]